MNLHDVIMMKDQLHLFMMFENNISIMNVNTFEVFPIDNTQWEGYATYKVMHQEESENGGLFLYTFCIKGKDMHLNKYTFSKEF
jgi:hypothetical protein